MKSESLMLSEYLVTDILLCVPVILTLILFDDEKLDTNLLNYLRR